MITSCSSSELHIKEYLTYLADLEHGIVKNKTVTGIALQVKYLPIDYLVYKETNQNGGNATEIAITKKNYDESLSFLFTLGPSKEEKFDIAYLGVRNYREFIDRVETMNFKMNEMFYLELNGKKIKPKLTLMENTYGLEKSRSLVVTFPVANSSHFMRENDVKFVYEDGLFKTGISKFSFKKKDMTKLPTLIF